MDSIPQILSDIRGYGSASDPVPKILADIKNRNGGTGGISQSRQQLWADIRGTGNSRDNIHQIISDIRGTGNTNDSIAQMLADIRDSGVLSPVIPIPVPVNQAVPTISGTLTEDETLSTTNGTWTNTPTSYAYQWIRRDSGGLNPADIGGATASTYLLVTADVGNTIQVKVTASNAGGASSPAYSAVSAVIASSGPQSLTNVQKLSQDPSTPAGRQVSVSDAFFVSGVGDVRDGFYFFDTVLPDWRHPGSYNPDLDPIVENHPIDDDNFWWIISPELGSILSTTPNVIDPWDATWPAPVVAIHPAIQELQTPSAAQGGVFVAGGAQDGVYAFLAGNPSGSGRQDYLLLGGGNTIDDKVIFWETDRWKIAYPADTGNLYYSLSDVATPDLAGTDKMVMAVDGVAYSKRGTSAGKSYYNKIGEANSTILNAIVWSSATWHITNAIGVDLDTSTNDVATPDLATFLLGEVVTNVAWLNAADDTPVTALAVTSVTAGQLAAGLRIGADTFVVNGAENGRNKYVDVLGVAFSINWILSGGGKWVDANSTDMNLGNVAFPYLGTPEVTVTRDDVAAEANWAAP